MQRLVLSVFLVVVTAALARPAYANITGATLTGATSYSGACPTTMSFTGAITGTPGTSFSYSFNRYVNGVQQVVNQGTHVLSAGSFPVSDSVNIASTTSGTTFDQVWVHNISGGQPDVYGNQLHFTVTCGGQPGPTPTPTPTPIVTQSPAAPTKAVGFSPSAMRNSDFYKWGEFDSPSCLHTFSIGSRYKQDAWSTKQLVVGWTEYHSGGFCWEWETSTYRGAVKFDLSSLAGKKAQKAILTFHVDNSHPLRGSTPVSCADGLYLGTMDWINAALSSHIPVGADVGSVHAPQGWVAVDVTSPVNAWLSGKATNNGFVMKGRMENLTQQGNAECTSIYGKFRLDVKYFT
jgi:hypothetical protein